MSIAADFDEVLADFEPVDPAAQVIELLIRGNNRRDIADKLGISLMGLKTLIAQRVREWSAETGTPREANAVAHMSLDAIVATGPPPFFAIRTQCAGCAKPSRSGMATPRRRSRVPPRSTGSDGSGG